VLKGGDPAASVSIVIGFNSTGEPEAGTFTGTGAGPTAIVSVRTPAGTWGADRNNGSWSISLGALMTWSSDAQGKEYSGWGSVDGTLQGPSGTTTLHAAFTF
jgi:hypothetical protein